jgi:hypothetical protein
VTEPLDLAAIRAHASPPKRGMFLCPTCADNQIALCDEIERLRADNLERHRICGDLRAALAVRDQNRDELQYSSVKGKNPFKDKRVREAMQLAIDVQAIKSQVMRGLSVPTGVNLPISPDCLIIPDWCRRCLFSKNSAHFLRSRLP